MCIWKKNKKNHVNIMGILIKNTNCVYFIKIKICCSMIYNKESENTRNLNCFWYYITKLEIFFSNSINKLYIWFLKYLHIWFLKYQQLQQGILNSLKKSSEHLETYKTKQTTYPNMLHNVVNDDLLARTNFILPE